MSRKRPTSEPCELEIMDKGAMGWMYRYAHKNLWRVASHMDMDDLVSEGNECYYYVLRHYPKAKDRPHVMRLFQLTFRSRIQDLAKKSSRQVDQCMGDLIFQDELHVPDAETATLAVLVSQAPPRIKAAIALFSSEPGLRQLRKNYRTYESGSRETLNSRLRRLTGCQDKSIDLVRELREYFASA